jgi:predicted Fe-Mo cluster-binding NifX family protein
MKKITVLALMTLFLFPGLVFAGQTGKICVATKDKSPEGRVSDKAALAPYLLIFDEKGNLIESIDNPLKTKSMAAGKLIGPFLAKKGVSAVIGTDFCGDIIGILKHQGVTAYNFEGTALDAVASLVSGSLAPASQENALVANHKVMMNAMRTGKEKIAVAANGAGPEAPVSPQLASSPFFLVFDQQGNVCEIIENPYKSAEMPGPSVVNFLAEKGVTIVVAGDFGPKILEVLKAKQIWPVPFKGSAQEAVRTVLKTKKTG